MFSQFPKPIIVYGTIYQKDFKSSNWILSKSRNACFMQYNLYCWRCMWFLFCFLWSFFVFVFVFCFVIVVLFMFLIYQEQGNDLSLKKQWCIWRSHLCPLKLICHIKEVFLNTSRPLPMIILLLLLLLYNIYKAPI